MSVSVTMPRLGESVSEGTVTRWLKKEGERVEADEPLLEVSTDKVDTEIPSPTSGVVSAIKVAEDETVEVGAELATIDEGGTESGSDGASSREPAQEPAAEAAAAEPEPEPEPMAGSGEPAETSASEPGGAGGQPAAQGADQPGTAQVAQPQPSQTPAPAGGGDGESGGAAYVTPLVRKLAAERGIDLSSLSGTGVGGRIRKQDVLAARPGDGHKPAGPERPEFEPAPSSAPKAEAPPPAHRAAAGMPVRGRTEKLSRLRTVIANRMTESLQVSAQLTTVAEADITTIARLRERVKDDFEQREGARLSFLPFFASAVCEALKAHPSVNSSVDLAEGTVTYHDAVHLGIAVDTDRGLLVPVIHDAGDLNLGGLARKIADLANRTRSNAVSPDELGGGTFTLTNTGSRGALFDTPIINQPQVGILGTGSVVKRPVVITDQDLGEVIAVRSMVYLALTYDHRIVDGADAARFLHTVQERLEEGAFASQLGP
jgi:pyruvate dehydrogenase E2 component (dihydrolipoamide acetyltransferase)